MRSAKSNLVRKREFARRLGCGFTKFWELEKAGVIPPAVHLPMLNGEPGRVCYWPESVVEDVLRKMAGTRPDVAPYLNDPFGRSTVEAQ